jgi:hypothetical protein
MVLTIQRVATVLSIHQLDDADDHRKAATVQRVCTNGKVRKPAPAS